jgi:RNA polymerase sigma-B factor
MYAFVSEEHDAGHDGFALSDIGSVPAECLSQWFSRKGRRCKATEKVTGNVIMGPPDTQVDLVTVRPANGSSEIPHRAIDQLREGGQLLLAVPAAETPPALEAVDSSRRLFRKIRHRSSGTRQRAVAPPVEVENLALRQLRSDLIMTHDRLARSLARRFSHRGEPAEDLEQVALLALVKAARRFDPGRNVAFATYATASILGELKRHFRDKGWGLRVPRSIQELYLRVQQAREELEHRLGTCPNVSDIATHLGVADEDVLHAMEAGSAYWTASLDAPSPDGEPSTEVGVEDRSFDKALDRQRLQEVLPRLEWRERVILKRLYFDGLTQDKVAAEIGISQMQVSRVLARTLAKLRGSMAASEEPSGLTA